MAPIRPPAPPFAIRALNAVGGSAARIGIQPIKLAAGDLLEAARRNTGLSDFGDDQFREGLSRLVDSLEREARLSTIGRFIARQDLCRHLENRLWLVEWSRLHPEIDAERIERPIIICGQGRTGTTILHELMALDPANRVPLTWECDRPFPPPERETYRSDPRIAEVQATLDQSERLIPDFKKMHRMGATLPQECVRITAVEFASMIFTAQWRVPSYTQWLVEAADMSRAYQLHAQFLKLLQWRCPGERWVLKSPGHLWSLDELAIAMPDARLIQTHRDPLKILSSITSLEVVLRSMSSASVDAHDIAREWSRWNCRGYDESVDFRGRGALPASQVVDVLFHEFIRDPVSEVRRIYRHFDLALDPEVEARMLRYVAENPSDRDGRHVHRFEDTGLDAEAEREKVERYQEFFGVPSEP